ATICRQRTDLARVRRSRHVDERTLSADDSLCRNGKRRCDARGRQPAQAVSFVDDNARRIDIRMQIPRARLALLIRPRDAVGSGDGGATAATSRNRGHISGCSSDNATFDDRAVSHVNRAGVNDEPAAVNDEGVARSRNRRTDFLNHTVAHHDRAFFNWRTGHGDDSHIGDRVPRGAGGHLSADIQARERRRGDRDDGDNKESQDTACHDLSPQRAMYFLNNSTCELSSGRSRPAMITCRICDRISNGSPVRTTRFATLPASMLATWLSTPSARAAAMVSVFI